MEQRYELNFVWRGPFEATFSGQHFIEAADTVEAIRRAEAFWHTQSFVEWPLGFDLSDPVGTTVHQFRSGRSASAPPVVASDDWQHAPARMWG